MATSTIFPLTGNMLTYIQKLHSGLYSCCYGVTLASRQSLGVEGENLCREEGTMSWFSSGWWAGRLGSEAQVCRHCLYRFELLNSPSERANCEECVLFSVYQIFADWLWKGHPGVCWGDTCVQGFGFGSLISVTKMPSSSKLVMTKFLNKKL